MPGILSKITEEELYQKLKCPSCGGKQFILKNTCCEIFFRLECHTFIEKK